MAVKAGVMTIDGVGGNGFMQFGFVTTGDGYMEINEADTAGLMKIIGIAVATNAGLMRLKINQ